MQDLTPVGLSEDGTTLVLVSSSGEEFAVRVDTRLRAALRGENARLGQLEMKMDSALRPRDIQTRIRAGESPEDVAAAAKTTVEAIMPYAGPVLAERAHVAQTALKASLRRRSGEATSQARTLGEAAELHLAEHSLHDEDVEWDSWRRPDGRWALVASYTVSGSARTAEFTHDLPGRYVVAENDHARVLTGELRAPGPLPAAGTRAAQVRRLSSVPAQDELPLGDDAIELVRDRPETGDGTAVTAPAPRPARRDRRRGLDRDSHARPRRRARCLWTRRRPATSRPSTSPTTRRPRPRSRRRKPAPATTQEGPLVGALVGRDHVRRRQERVTGPTGPGRTRSGSGCRSGLLAGNIVSFA